MIELSFRSVIWTLVIFTLLRAFLKSLRNHYKLAHIPTVGGPSGFLTSYLGVWNNIWKMRDSIEEGYSKYYGQLFKIAQMNRWMVVLSSPESIQDYVNASDDYMSLPKTFAELLSTKYTIGADIVENDHKQVEVVRTQLTRNIKALFGDLHEEVGAAFADYIPAKDDWNKVLLMDATRHIVCRLTNRLFVGLPLCRDSDYIELNINFTIEIMKASHLLNVTPGVLKPVVAYLFSTVPSSIEKAMRLIGPFVEERLAKDAAEGPHWAGKPNDYLAWFLADADEKDKNAYDMVRRILMLNMAAIHTSSATFTVAAYNLIAFQEYVEPLREEVDNVIAAEGWTKAAMGRMHKLDSFIKESARITGQSMISPSRILLKDFTLSSGITIPAGTFIAFPSQAMHDDENLYPNASAFDGFRFCKMKESHAQDGKFVNQQMVNVNPEYNLFGFGRHACPGRFFAVNEIKLMLAYMLMNYDFKFEDGKHAPPPRKEFGSSLSPDPSVNVLFRARAQT